MSCILDVFNAIEEEFDNKGACGPGAVAEFCLKLLFRNQSIDLNIRFAAAKVAIKIGTDDPVISLLSENDKEIIKLALEQHPIKDSDPQLLRENYPILQAMVGGASKE